jgi:hypothetical protein
MAITHVASATPYTRASSGTGYTLNAPAGLASGDVLLATVAWDPTGSQRSITVPEGWVVLRTSYSSGDSRSIQVALLYRQAGPSEPSSWSGSVGASTSAIVTGVSAYRGAQGSLGSNAGSLGPGTSFSTGTVNNTGSGSWRIVAAAYSSSTSNYNITSNEASRRWIEEAEPSFSIQAAQWDSNAAIATGNTSRTVSRSATWSCAAGIVMVLAASSGTPATGTMSCNLPALSADGEVEVHNDASLTASLPSVAFEGEGFGQPPLVDGVVGATLPLVEASMELGSDVTAELGASIPVSFSGVGETRLFGVRVVQVEADDRVVRVESRAVAD